MIHKIDREVLLLSPEQRSKWIKASPKRTDGSTG